MSQPKDQEAESIGVPEELAVKVVRGEVTIAQMVGLSPENLYAIARQGHALLKTGKVADAVRIYRGLVTASPYDSLFHAHLGAALQASDQVDEALEHYDLALQFNQKNVEALVGRGELRLKLKRTIEALQDLREAVAIDPEAKKPATARAKTMLHMLQSTMIKRLAQSVKAAQKNPAPPPRSPAASTSASGPKAKPPAAAKPPAPKSGPPKPTDAAPTAAARVRNSDGFSEGPKKK